MERRDTEDFQWPYMANPTLQNLQLSSPNNHRILINGSQDSCNSNFYQNLALQNYDLFQNPGSQVSCNANFNQNYDLLQNPGSQVPCNPNHNHALQNFDLFQNPGSQVPCNPYQNYALQNFNLFQNPSSSQGYRITQGLPQVSRPSRPFYEGLEDSFSRMNLNVSSNNNSHSPLIYSNVPLQRMRVESAVRGQKGLYQEGFGGHSNSARSIGSQNMLGEALTRSANFPSTPVANDFDYFSLQCRSRYFEGLDYASSRRLNTLAMNGLESGNFSSNSLSSLYNHRAVNPPQRSKYSCSGQVSSDQSRRRFWQKKHDHKEIEMIFLKVKDRLHDFIIHQFDNHVVQKLLEASDQEQRTELLLLLVSNKQRFLLVCTDVHGTWVVQKFMERISTREEGAILLSALKPIAFTLTINNYGRHIIEQCLNKFSNEDTQQIVHEIAKHCYDTATDQSGCRVLQQCLAYGNAEARELMLAEIVANAVDLSLHPFGNYAVQYAFGMKIPQVTPAIIMQLRDNFVTLSINKHGSHVVETCLQVAGEELSAMIIREIMDHEDFSMVVQDQFGNYVVAKALIVSKGDLRKALVEKIQGQLPFLESHVHGKNVAQRLKGGKKRV